MLGEEQDVLWAFTQRGKREGHHGEPMVEVVPETSGARMRSWAGLMNKRTSLELTTAMGRHTARGLVCIRLASQSARKQSLAVIASTARCSVRRISQCRVCYALPGAVPGPHHPALRGILVRLCGDGWPS